MTIFGLDRYTPEMAGRALEQALARFSCHVRHRRLPPCQLCAEAAAQWTKPIARVLVELEVGSPVKRSLTDREAQRLGRMLEALEALVPKPKEGD